MKYYSICCLLILLAAVAVPYLAGATEAVGKEVLEISSDTMTIENQSLTIIFKGVVEAKYAGATITAEVLTAYFHAETKRLLRLKAEGGVRIVQGDRAITGQWAEFDQEKGQIRVVGNSKITDGKSVLEGKEVVVDLISRRGSISGGVRAVFDTSVFPAEFGGMESQKEIQKTP